MKLAVLTSGGDSAGMNAVVRAVVKTAIIKCDLFLLGICACVLDTVIVLQGLRDVDRP